MSLPVHLAPSLEGASVGGTVVLTGDEAHHAVAVRRVRPGERVVLTDGRGTSVVGEVTATDRRRLEARVLERESVPRPQPSLTVVQALPKGDRGELAVEMLTEVGAELVVPWAASRSVAVWRGERAERSHAKWASAAREAAKQSRRRWFPEVARLATTADVADLVSDADLAVVLHEEAASPMAELDVPREGRLLVVVGPEGGLAAEEIGTFVAAGATCVRLGSEVLRTSTAGVVAAGVLLSHTGRWR